MKKILSTAITIVTAPLVIVGFAIFKGIKAISKKPNKANW